MPATIPTAGHTMREGSFAHDLRCVDGGSWELLYHRHQLPQGARPIDHIHGLPIGLHLKASIGIGIRHPLSQRLPLNLLDCLIGTLQIPGGGRKVAHEAIVVSSAGGQSPTGGSRPDDVARAAI